MKYTPENYSAFVRSRFKVMPTWEQTLMHGTVGVAGEAGELLDASKKAWIYGQPLNIVNAQEELGDIEFYLEAVRQHLGLSREAILAANIDKLEKRYPEGYSDAAAAARADKVA